MNRWVFDSSAVLAVLFQEPGHQLVESLISEGCISSVNVAEVFSKLAEKDQLTEEDVRDFTQLDLEIVDFDLVQASKVAKLRPLTRQLGLSLGDRCCLALAIINNATAVTADRDWKKLSLCPIELIR